MWLRRWLSAMVLGGIVILDEGNRMSEKELGPVWLRLLDNRRLCGKALWPG